MRTRRLIEGLNSSLKEAETEDGRGGALMEPAISSGDFTGVTLKSLQTHTCAKCLSCCSRLLKRRIFKELKQAARGSNEAGKKWTVRGEEQKNVKPAAADRRGRCHK